MTTAVFRKVKALLGASQHAVPAVRPLLRASQPELDDLLASPAASDSKPLDPQTWKDLDLGRLADRISRSLSVTGEVFLHLRLRSGGSAADLSRFRSAMQQPEKLCDCLALFADMRRAQVNICDPLFVSSFGPVPPLGRWAWLPIPLFIASMALIKFSPLAWLGIVATLVFTAFVSIRLYLPMKLWHMRREALLFAVATARLLQAKLPPHIRDGLTLPDDHELDSVEKTLKPSLW